eukprot:8882111-Lingulodinium_polyedra.AAC.1
MHGFGWCWMVLNTVKSCRLMLHDLDNRWTLYHYATTNVHANSHHCAQRSLSRQGQSMEYG